MSEYIDCDNCYHGSVCAYRHHKNELITDCNHYTPKADVVEVVRCKDCKHLLVDDEGYTYCSDTCGLDGIDLDDFCCDGERE